MDLAVAVIIGAAFSAIINSFANDLITPLLSLLIGGMDLSHLSVQIGVGDTAVSLGYGKFIQALINFFFLSLMIFLLIKAIGVILRRKKEEAPATKTCPYCAQTIPEIAVRCPSCTTILDENAVPKNLR